MGVKGLWKLLEGTGHPVNLETLEGKILAVDISVWLNMAIKGMRDYHGHSSQSAHLITLFNRICKLLHYGIKPVFVFDGQAPNLKQKTLRERRERKTINYREGKKTGEKILQNYLKKQLLEEVSGDVSQEQSSNELQNIKITTPEQRKPPNTRDVDIYELPALSSHLIDSDEDELEEELKIRAELQSEFHDNAGHIDISSMLNMDVDSKDFEALPSDVQYELLQDLHEVRKRQRTRIEAMPEESNSFSNYQLKGLLAKRKITKKMEHVQMKMSEERLSASHALSGVSDELMDGHIVDARQLVSDSTSHFIWMRKIKQIKGESTNAEKSNDAAGHDKQNSRKMIFTTCMNQTAKNADQEGICQNASKQTEVSETISHHESSGQSPDLQSEISSNKHLTKTDLVVGDSVPLKDSIDFAKNSNQRNVTGPIEYSATAAYSTSATKLVNDNDNNDSSSSESKIKNLEKYSENEMSRCSEELSQSNTQQSSHVSSNASAPQNNDTFMSQSPANASKMVTGKENLKETPESETEPRLDSDTKMVTNSVQAYVKSSDIVENSEISKLAKASDNESSDDEFVDVPDLSYHDGYKNCEPAVLKEDDDATAMFMDSHATKDSEDDLEIADVNPWEGLDIKSLEQYTSEIDEQSKELRKMMQARERAAKDLTHSAQLECQELLKLFGLPYIISPQEAEAQCATLETLDLTHGTITEDSDIWLFGGKYVIKNMFGSKNDPTAYKVSDIEMQLGLNRDRFISLALCTGSDYTTGIHGVGPVTAMEILKEFEGEGIEGLQKLREWWDSVVTSPKQIIPTETKIKSQLRRVNLRKDFPSQTVFKAYMQPVVNKENRKFEWGFPDLEELRMFATGTMGWTRQKVDEILLPLMKKLSQQRSAQARITKYFASTSHTVTRKKSKRVMRAAAALTGKNDIDGKVRSKRTKKIIKKRQTPKSDSLKSSELGLSESSSEDG